jgi:hypothetical protein
MLLDRKARARDVPWIMLVEMFWGTKELVHTWEYGVKSVVFVGQSSRCFLMIYTSLKGSSKSMP